MTRHSLSALCANAAKTVVFLILQCTMAPLSVQLQHPGAIRPTAGSPTGHRLLQLILKPSADLSGLRALYKYR